MTTTLAISERLLRLEKRLDARAKAAPGQLNLFGGGSGGKGQPCGQGWISRDKTCQQGAGGANPKTAPSEAGGPGSAPSEARRSRPKERVAFENPITGPTGARLTGYTWQWTTEEVQDQRGETVERRVSDWEKSIANVETGRNVVHQFEVEHQGQTRVVSAESALKLMGYTDPLDRKQFKGLQSTARTVARLRMAQHQLDELEKKWQKDWGEVEMAPRPEVSIGEWRTEDWGRRREWRMGDATADQIENSNGISSEQDMHAQLNVQWKAERMREKGWSYTGQRKTSMANKIQYERSDLAKRLQRAETKLQQASRTDGLSSLLGACLTRLDSLSRLVRSSASDFHARRLHAAPEVALAVSGAVASVTGLSGQQHWTGKAAHTCASRFDQGTADGDGQPCGETFISPKYVCRVGKNVGTSADLNVHLEADPDRADDIKRAIRHYTNTPGRIQKVQARIAIQAGWDVGVYGFKQDESLSRLGLDRVVLKETRARAELLEHYIEKAPKYEGDVYRGVWFGSSKEAEDFLTDLQDRYVPAVDSWTATRKVAEDFSGVNEPRSRQKAAVILKQRNVHGASIKRYSGIPGEDEVLQPSGIKYRILAITERVEGSLRPLKIYEVDVEPIEHRPMVRKTVMDRLDAFEARLDAVKRKCSTGYGCGRACISVQKECRKEARSTASKERISRLEQLARGEIKPRGIGALKPAEAKAKAKALRAEAAEQRAVTKAERERRKAEAAKTGRKPSVEVKLRRAKPGGEYGPDGHWYPGGSWMSEGEYVGAKPAQAQGAGQGAAAGSGTSGEGKTPRVVRPKEKPARLQPTEPKGEGLPRPKGLKKTAEKNDREFFNDRGYISEGLRYGDGSLTGASFEAAVAQRMTAEELNWATDQIVRMTGADRSELSEDIEWGIRVYGSEKDALESHRFVTRNELIGVDDERLKAAIIFMRASRYLGTSSPAQQRLRSRRGAGEDEEGRKPPERKPRQQGGGRKDPGYGDWIWGLNNVFRAVRIRRERGER